MKIAVLGASGGVGKQLVEQARARGHDVTAIVRASSSFHIAGVRVERGDLSSTAFLQAAFAGHDAVASGLGLKLPSLSPFAKAEDPDFLRTSTTAIVAAMKAAGVKRVCAVSSSGVGDSAALLPGFFRVITKLTALRVVMVKLDEMEQLYRGSGLEVCLVRPTGLTDKPASGQVMVPSRLVGRAEIARADVAAFMLDQIEKPAFDRTAPVVTTTGG